MKRVDLFALAKANVTPRQAAERYGLSINRAGFAVCPFHAEKTGSLKFYDNGTAHCFGSCCQNFDSVDIAAALNDLTALEAAKLLCTDFGLDPKVASARRPEGIETPYQKRQREQVAENKQFNLLCELEQTAHELLKTFTPETSEDSMLFRIVLERLGYAQDRLNNMLS